MLGAATAGIAPTWAIEQWITMVSMVATSFAAFFAAIQAQRATSANKTSSWSVLISLEAAIANARAAWESALSDEERISIEAQHAPGQLAYYTQ